MASLLTLIAGILNVLASCLFSCGTLGGIPETAGLSLLFIIFFLPGVPIGLYGAYQGFMQLTIPPGESRPRPLLPAALQLVGLLSCSMISVCMGVVAVALLSTQEAKDHYERASS